MSFLHSSTWRAVSIARSSAHSVGSTSSSLCSQDTMRLIVPCGHNLYSRCRLVAMDTYISPIGCHQGPNWQHSNGVTYYAYYFFEVCVNWLALYYSVHDHWSWTECREPVAKVCLNPPCLHELCLQSVWAAYLLPFRVDVPLLSPPLVASCRY